MHPEIEAALRKHNVAYTEHAHTSYSVQINTPMDFANALGYTLERITKSVFVRSVNREKYAMVVCSINKKINFVQLATHLACKKVEVATKDELEQLVGYPVNGVAPIGLKNIPVIMDSALLNHETVLIGGGVAKVEIELSPLSLQLVSEASLLSITL